MDLKVVPAEQAALGIKRGQLLVNQVTSLKKAAQFHHLKNDQERAYRTMHQLASLFRKLPDPTLEKEQKLVLKLEHTLAGMSGHRGEISSTKPLDPITNLPSY